MSRYIDHARTFRAEVEAAGTMLTDEQALAVLALFMPWDPTKKYDVGDRARYGDLLYRCLQAHTAQMDWTPGTAVSLWTRVDDPAVEWPEWVQPESTNPYPLGAKVSYNGKHWVSLHAANVWVPGTAGLWEEQA